MLPRFIQFHTLHSYPAVLINRDAAGLAKRIPFGGVTRTRISSQCLKRHWRVADDPVWGLDQIGVPMGVRTRAMFRRELCQPLIESGIATEVAEAITLGFMQALLQEGKKTKEAKKKTGKKSKKAEGADTDAELPTSDVLANGPGDKSDPLATSQAILFGKAEIAYLLDKARVIAAASSSPEEASAAVDKFFAAEAENIGAMKCNAGLEAMLFGRMITSDILARTDAAVHVAHAFTVHAEQTDNDYFTVVDDLLTGSEGAGSAGIFDSELTSGLFYGYVVVDVPLLVSNIEGLNIGDKDAWKNADRSLAARTVEHLGHLIATVSPGAKKGSTAPYGYAQAMLVEMGNRQPRSLANAFERPVRGADGLSERAMAALADHLQALDAMFGCKEERLVASLTPTTIPGATQAPVDEILATVAERIRGG